MSPGLTFQADSGYSSGMRNVPGKPGPKSRVGPRVFVEGEQGSVGCRVLVEGVLEDYERARRRVEWWRYRVRKHGSTTKNRDGMLVMSVHQKGLWRALDHQLAMTRLYFAVVKRVVGDAREVHLTATELRQVGRLREGGARLDFVGPEPVLERELERVGEGVLPAG